MKKTIYFPLFAAALLITGFSAQGQIFKKLKEKVENKVEQAADDVLDGKDSEKRSRDAKQKTTRLPGSIGVYDFVPGKNVIFIDSIQYAQLGQMPEYWKAGGTGIVAEFPGAKGKWLKLKTFTTYKLDTLFAMPENFTIEFDLLTRSNELKDLHSVSFGFSSDNSVSGYEEQIVAKTMVHYWNQAITNISKDTDLYNSFDFDLQNYSNAVMHVAIQVDGKNMKVYLDKNKVLDTRVFEPNRKKYFFINLSTRIDNNAEIAISNFKVAI